MVCKTRFGLLQNRFLGILMDCVFLNFLLSCFPISNTRSWLYRIIGIITIFVILKVYVRQIFFSQNYACMYAILFFSWLYKIASNCNLNTALLECLAKFKFHIVQHFSQIQHKIAVNCFVENYFNFLLFFENKSRFCCCVIKKWIFFLHFGCEFGLRDWNHVIM